MVKVYCGVVFRLNISVRIELVSYKNYYSIWMIWQNQNQLRVQERLNLQMNDTISNDIAFISRSIEIDMTNTYTTNVIYVSARN